MKIKDNILFLESQLRSITTNIANARKKSASKSSTLDELLAKKAEIELKISEFVSEDTEEENVAESGEDVLNDEAIESEAEDPAIDIDEDVEADLEEVPGESGDIAESLGDAIADVLSDNFDDDQTIGEVLDTLSVGEDDEDLELDLEEDDDEEFEPSEDEFTEEFEEESEESPEEEVAEEVEEESEPEFTVKNAHCKKCKCNKIVQRDGKIMCKECGSQIVITIDLPEGMEIETDNIVEESGDLAPEDEHDLGTSDTEEAVEEIFNPENSEEEESETPEEEHEEHESEEEEEDEHEKAASYSAKFYKKSNKKDSYWIVFKDEKPVFKVKSASAYTNINAKPVETELSKYASYYDVFKSEDYKSSLIGHCLQVGWEKTCGLAHGKMAKSAQVVPSGTVAGQNPEQPFGNTTQEPGAATEEPVPGDTLNPDEGTQEMFEADLPSKMLVTDVIANLLAIEVANGSYTVEEILDELKAVFADEAAASEFEGQLQQKADTYSDVVEESKEEEPAPEEAPMEELPAPPMEANQSEGTSPVMTEPAQPVKAAAEMCDKCNKPKNFCSCKETEEKDEEIEKKEAKIAELEEKTALRYKVATAYQFVQNEMIPRGLVDSDTASISSEVKKLVNMEKSACENYMEMVERVPKKSEEDKEQEDIIKNASAFNAELGGLSKVPFIEKTEVKTGIDALLNDNMFETRLSKIASENVKKKQRWN